MRPVIQKLLLEGCETDTEEYGTEKLVKYLDKSLIKLKNKLKPATFDKVFAILWENASVALRYLITTNIEVKHVTKTLFPDLFKTNVIASFLEDEMKGAGTKTARKFTATFCMHAYLLCFRNGDLQVFLSRFTT